MRKKYNNILLVLLSIIVIAGSLLVCHFYIDNKTTEIVKPKLSRNIFNVDTTITKVDTTLIAFGTPDTTACDSICPFTVTIDALDSVSCACWSGRLWWNSMSGWKNVSVSPSTPSRTISNLCRTGSLFLAYKNECNDGVGCIKLKYTISGDEMCTTVTKNFCYRFIAGESTTYCLGRAAGCTKPSVVGGANGSVMPLDCRWIHAGTWPLIPNIPCGDFCLDTGFECGG